MVSAWFWSEKWCVFWQFWSEVEYVFYTWLGIGYFVFRELCFPREVDKFVVLSNVYRNEMY